MEVTFKKMESSRLQTSGVGTKIGIEGVITLDGNGKISESSGTFTRVTDNMTIGNFNTYSGNKSFSNMTDEELICDCVTELSAFILAAETKAGNLTYNI